MGNQLPLWALYIQALGFPFIGFCLALVGARIAQQQMRIARIKLQHDLYERRLAIFSAARDLLSAVVVKGSPTGDQIAQFAIKTVDASFHFDNDILDYLDRIQSLASALLVDEQTVAGLTTVDPSLEKRIRDNRRWLQDQIQEKALTKGFMRYLAIDPASRL